MKILIDSREQQPFSFSFSDCELVRGKLDYGDYTSELLKDRLRIERKASTGELYLNLVGKKENARFHRELEELAKFEFSYIIVECPESDLHTFPENSGIPRKRWKFLRAGDKYLRKMIHEIEDKYNIPFIFCDNKSEAELLIFNLIRSLECDTQYIK